MKRQILPIATLGVLGLLVGAPAAHAHNNGPHPFKNCAQALEYGYSAIPEGDEHYAKHLDADLDGVACEVPPSPVADTVDIAAWMQANKDTVELFLDIDVDTCKGLDGLTYEQAVSLADVNGIDLKELANKTTPAEILDYADNAGVTLEDLDNFLTAFCAGDITPPPPASTAPGKGSESPSDSKTSSPSASEDKTDKPSPSVSETGATGKMADTGGLSPWTPLGIGVGAVALGGGGFYWARRMGKI